ncbi:MAG: hypothetical protein CBB97_00440 [Candidatus Endolissoclinum sp. TMED37]|nr:MAG: hypothetical protein CBB97_00440 [Candidatus Endolissoclinum sp. TMED37]
MQIAYLLLIIFGCFAQKQKSVGVVDIIDEKVCMIQVVETEELIEVNPTFCLALKEGDILWVNQKEK